MQATARVSSSCSATCARGVSCVSSSSHCPCAESTAQKSRRAESSVRKKKTADRRRTEESEESEEVRGKWRRDWKSRAEEERRAEQSHVSRVMYRVEEDPALRSRVVSVARVPCRSPGQEQPADAPRFAVSSNACHTVVQAQAVAAARRRRAVAAVVVVCRRPFASCVDPSPLCRVSRCLRPRVGCTRCLVCAARARPLQPVTPPLPRAAVGVVVCLRSAAVCPSQQRCASRVSSCAAVFRHQLMQSSEAESNVEARSFEKSSSFWMHPFGNPGRVVIVE